MSQLEEYRASFDDEPGYLDWAAFGPLAPSVRAEVHADSDLLATGRRSGIELVEERLGEARELIGELIDAPADQVTLQPSTTQGLMQALFGVSGTILVSSGDFPSLTLGATRAAQAREDTSVAWMTPDADGFVTPDLVRDALTDDVAAVAVSLVDYRTGYLAD
ncbi:aminotransferase class V-fold PLP-dependent enzyme, partial [Microbacterium terricola]